MQSFLAKSLRGPAQRTMVQQRGFSSLHPVVKVSGELLCGCERSQALPRDCRLQHRNFRRYNGHPRAATETAELQKTESGGRSLSMCFQPSRAVGKLWAADLLVQPLMCRRLLPGLAPSAVAPELEVTKLDVRVGRIVNVEAHPEADSYEAALPLTTLTKRRRPVMVLCSYSLMVKPGNWIHMLVIPAEEPTSPRTGLQALCGTS